VTTAFFWEKGTERGVPKKEVLRPPRGELERRLRYYVRHWAEVAAGGTIMGMQHKFSRRKFVSSAVSASAISVLPGSRGFFGEFTGAIGTRELEQNPVSANRVQTPMQVWTPVARA